MATEWRRLHGFTLLEVLVALVIVALGLLAVFGQLNQSITVATRLRDKTLAQWVAVNYLTEQRLAGAFPPEGRRSEERELAGRSWRLEIRVRPAQLAGLRQVEIDVAQADNPAALVTTLFGALREPGPEPGPADAAWRVTGPGGDTGGNAP